MNSRPLIIALVCTLAWACAPDDNPGTTVDGWLDADVPTDTTGDSDASGCTSTTPYCSTDLTQVMTCNPATGAASVVQTCSTGEACVAGACVTVACMPGSSECVDDDTVAVCNDEGSSSDWHECPSDQRCDEDTGRCELICLLRIFILLDQSGSMGGEPPTKWDQAQEALATLMTGTTAEDVEFGFGVFPTDGDCATDAVVVHPVPDATDAMVDDYFVDNSPSGMTPLVDVMSHFRTDTTANINDPAYHNAVLLVSDGSDTCFEDCSHCGIFDIACQNECSDSFDALILSQLAHDTEYMRDTLSVRTFVIGFGSGVSDDELSTIAVNGGTILGDWIPASDVDELEAAFETILSEMYECNPIMI